MFGFEANGLPLVLNDVFIFTEREWPKVIEIIQFLINVTVTSRMPDCLPIP